MNYSNSLLISLLVFLGFSCAPVDTNVSVAGHYVQVKKEPTIKLKSGAMKELKLQFQVEEAYHIMTNAGEDENFMNTSLSIEENPHFKFEAPAFPPSVAHTIDGIDKPILVFEDSFLVRVGLKAGPSVSKGEYTLNGNLFYQACDSKKCFFPKELPITIHVEVI